MPSGILGFRLGHKDKITFVMNAENLNITLKEWCSDPYNWRRLRGNINSMKRVEGSPTEDQILEVSMLLDIDLNPNATWYDLLRSTHGNPDRIFMSRYYEDRKSFFLTSPRCKVGYIINADRMELEVYECGAKKFHGLGRYAGKVNYGPKLIDVYEY